MKLGTATALVMFSLLGSAADPASAGTRPATPKPAAAKPAAAEAEADGKDTVECPKCTRVNPAKAKFCVGCGEQLRK